MSQQSDWPRNIGRNLGQAGYFTRSNASFEEHFSQAAKTRRGPLGKAQGVSESPMTTEGKE
ncbi:hypothetical protein [Olsenella sp. Marseille-QA0557]|uniref:hypothetical protein n=1 Tax=Olsenella sp. Marseille-QA0557 TaxID=3378782 RepID=UPI003D140631